MSLEDLQTVDEWREEHWGEEPCCTGCGDPVILADTEEWDDPLCAECYLEEFPPEAN